ncbi:MAG: hypothetical protein ACFE9L_20830 [Candidatus Hodarchaeota archaeon]
MKKSLIVILLIIWFIYSNISLMSPINNSKGFQIVKADYNFFSDNIEFKSTEITSNIAFSGFYDFLT